MTFSSSPRPVVIFINGPPRSGKDTLGNGLRNIAIDRDRVYLTKMAKPLKERTHALYGLFGPDGKPLPHDAFELVKDEPREEFLGLTPRNAYIEVSERYMKPVHGQDVWGKMLVKDVEHERGTRDIVTVTDSGFACEAEPVIRRFGVERCLLLRLYRENCSFINDSRSYINLDGVETIDLSSIYVEQLIRDGKAAVREFLKRQTP